MTETKVMNYKELAGAAATELERRGWTTGSLARAADRRAIYDKDDPALADCKVCAVGAMNVAVTGNPLLSGVANQQYGLFLKKDNPNYPEVCKIAHVFWSEYLDGDMYSTGICTETQVYSYNDNQTSGDPVIRLFRSIEAGNFDHKFEDAA